MSVDKVVKDNRIIAVPCQILAHMGADVAGASDHQDMWGGIVDHGHWYSPDFARFKRLIVVVQSSYLNPALINNSIIHENFI